MDILIAQYQKLFSEGCLEEALDRCCDYIFKLEQAGVKYPHRCYEIGAIAMNSCYWGIIARQSQMTGAGGAGGGGGGSSGGGATAQPTK